MKLLLTKILPLLIPIAIYVVWLIHTRKKARTLGQPKPRMREAPWLTMAVTGVAILIISLIALGLFTGDKPGGIYMPPHMKNGEIIPGEIKRQ